MKHCTEIVTEFNRDIDMSLGLDKCAVLHTVKGSVPQQPPPKLIPNLDTDEGYKYLGVLQSDTVHNATVKDRTKKTYIARL